MGIYWVWGALAHAQNVDVRSEDAGADVPDEVSAIVVSKLPKDARAAVNPGDDFYLYANHEWLTDVKIAPHSLSAGALRDATMRTKEDVDRLQAALLARDWPEGSDEAKYKTVFNTFLDEGSVSRQGLRPIRRSLRAIRLARNHREIARLLGDYRLDAGGLFRVGLRVSQQEGRAYIPHLGAARLLLGDPEVYLRQDALARSIRADGAALLEQLLRRGAGRFNLTKRVEDVLQLETRLARLAPAATDERDPSQISQLRSAASLDEDMPDFPWSSYFLARGLGTEARVNVAPFKDLNAVVEVFDQTPVRVWRDYLVLRMLMQYGEYLPDNIGLLTYQLEQFRTGVRRPLESRYERAGHFARRIMPDVLARHYIEAHLDAETLSAAEAMAEQMRGVYRRRILQASWLSEPTRRAALAKLDQLQFMIGEPPDWNDYSDYEPITDSLLATAYQSLQSRHRSSLIRLRERPKHGVRDVEDLRQHIFFSPLQVGAYYLPRLNAVILPAAYLQPPFFDPAADAAYNYGALGTTLGHEIGHAFDDQGSKYGPTGALENWWSDEDRARFDAMGTQLSGQFSGVEVVPGVALDTQLTLGENISDLAGVETALAGLLAVLDQDPSISPGDHRASLQRFFLSYAGKRRKLRRPETNALLSPRDRHSPPALRTNLILANIDAWYQAFGVTERDALWLAPEQRLRIW